MKWTGLLAVLSGLVLPAGAMAGTASLQDGVYRFAAGSGEANVLQQVQGGSQQIGILDEHVTPAGGAGCVIGALPDADLPDVPSPLPAEGPVPDNTPVVPPVRPTLPPVTVPPVSLPPVELPTARAAGLADAGTHEVSCSAPAAAAILEQRFDLGDLDDELTVNTGAERLLSVDAGSGDDHLDLIYSGQQLVVAAGDGNDSISLDGARSGPATIDCGAGVDDLTGAPAGAQLVGCERVDGRGSSRLTIGHVDAVGNLVDVVVQVPGAGVLVLSDSGKVLRRERVTPTRAQAYVFGLEPTCRATDGQATTIRARFRPRRGRVSRATKAVTLVSPQAGSACGG